MRTRGPVRLQVMGPPQRWCTITIVAPDGAELVNCELRGRGDPDLRAVDDVAQVALLAKRLGGHVTLRTPAPRLRELLELAGLGAC